MIPQLRQARTSSAQNKSRSHIASEVGAEFAESRQDHQLAGAGDYWLVFELPSVFVREIYDVEADLHGGVDVAAWAVADHPAVCLHDLVFADQFAVGVGTFLGNDFDEFKKTLQTGALDFSRLFRGLAFGE